MSNDQDLKFEQERAFSLSIAGASLSSLCFSTGMEEDRGKGVKRWVTGKEKNENEKWEWEKEGLTYFWVYASKAENGEWVFQNSFAEVGAQTGKTQNPKREKEAPKQAPQRFSLSKITYVAAHQGCHLLLP